MLDALRDAGTLRRYVPFDVDASTLSASVAKIRHDYPNIEIHAVCGDFEKYLSEIPVKGRRLFVFLGSTIGNLAPSHAPNSSRHWPPRCDRVTACCWAPTS